MERRARLIGWALLAPATLLVGGFLLYPLWVVVDTSLRSGRAPSVARLAQLPRGLGNYARALGDEFVWHAGGVTALYALGTILPAFLIGLGLALLLNRDFPGRRWLRSLLLLPWAVPGVVAAIGFLWMFDGAFGVVNAGLRALGLPGETAWFVREDTALAAVILPTVWKCFPFFALTLLAALQAIPQELYEAARVDGASPRAAFRHVTWPGLRGAAALALILQTLWVVKEFDIVWTTTAGGPSRATQTLSLLVYEEAFQFFRFGPAAAIGMLLLAVCATLSLAAMRWGRRGIH